MPRWRRRRLARLRRRHGLGVVYDFVWSTGSAADLAAELFNALERLKCDHQRFFAGVTLARPD